MQPSIACIRHILSTELAWHIISLNLSINSAEVTEDIAICRLLFVSCTPSIPPPHVCFTSKLNYDAFRAYQQTLDPTLKAFITLVYLVPFHIAPVGRTGWTWIHFWALALVHLSANGHLPTRPNNAKQVPSLKQALKNVFQNATKSLDHTLVEQHRAQWKAS